MPGLDVRRSETGLEQIPASGSLLLFGRPGSAATTLTAAQMSRVFFLNPRERAPTLLDTLERYQPAGGIAIDDYMRVWLSEDGPSRAIRVYGRRAVAEKLGMPFRDDPIFASDHYVPISAHVPLPSFLARYLPACVDGPDVVD